MAEEDPISISQGRVTGKVIEKVFFADSKQQLEGFWGLPSLRELKQTEQIVLPQKAAEFVKAKRKETDQDGKERGAVFGFKDNDVVISEEQTGKSSIQSLINAGYFGKATFSVDFENPLQYSWNRLFGKPNPVLFHNHPNLVPENVSASSLRLPNGKVLKIPPKMFLEYMNFILDAFSTADLEVFFQSNRYFNSMLLSTSNRLIYVAPSELFIQAGMARVDRPQVAYDKELDVLRGAAGVTILGIDPSELINSQNLISKLRFGKTFQKSKEIADKNPSLEDLKRMRDEALLRAAKKSGYEVFTSETADSSSLKPLVFPS